MGFAPHILSERTVPEKVNHKDLPTREIDTYAGELKALNRQKPEWQEAAISVGIGAGALSLVLFLEYQLIYYLKCKKPQSSDEF